MKPISTGSVILGGFLILFFVDVDIQKINKRLDALEQHKFQTWNDSWGNKGIVIDGLMFQAVGETITNK